MIGVSDMNRKAGTILLIITFAVAVLGVVSCGEDMPAAPKTQIVKKKINGQKKSTQPQSAKVKTGTAPKALNNVGKSPGEKSETKSPAKDPALTSKLIKESLAFSGTYSSKGRFDPFEPLFKSDAKTRVVSSKKRKRRTPQTPLERVAISQLKLTAIMHTAKGNSAIVEDATGKGYVVRKGTYVGLNSGQVLRIEKSRVMIEEEIEDVSGEFRIQNTELKLQKPAGEL